MGEEAISLEEVIKREAEAFYAKNDDGGFNLIEMSKLSPRT